MSAENTSGPGKPTPDEIFGHLQDHEARWAERQPLLERRGYMLRPRYRPNWTPSWRGTGKHPIDFEDGMVLPWRDHLIDATRTADEACVYIKRVQTGDTESRIATMLSAEALRRDARNHCVPIIDFFQDDDDASISYMVMPFLRLIDDPPMDIVDDLVDFTDQILEGLAFLHQHGVAHRDCSQYNLMMDANAMFPRGFHPVDGSLLPDGQTLATQLPRSSVRVRYYYVDFGISVHIPPEIHPKRVVGDAGRDQDVPELSDVEPYDPFKVDIFIIGNMLRREFHDKYSNVDFLAPLVASMTQQEPTARPQAEDALAQWKDIRQSLWLYQRRWWLVSRDTTWVYSLFIGVFSSVGATVYAVKRLLGWTPEFRA